jgi:hypothetical protein
MNWLLALLLSGVVGEKQELKLPTSIDLEFAQAQHIHSLAGPSGMVHCHRVRHYRAKWSDPGRQAEVRYEEIEGGDRWKHMKATLKFEDDRWAWVDGDNPRCSVTMIE